MYCKYERHERDVDLYCIPIYAFLRILIADWRHPNSLKKELVELQRKNGRSICRALPGWESVPIWGVCFAREFLYFIVQNNLLPKVPNLLKSLREGASPGPNAEGLLSLMPLVNWRDTVGLIGFLQHNMCYHLACLNYFNACRQLCSTVTELR